MGGVRSFVVCLFVAQDDAFTPLMFAIHCKGGKIFTLLTSQNCVVFLKVERVPSIQARSEREHNLYTYKNQGYYCDIMSGTDARLRTGVRRTEIRGAHAQRAVR